MFSLGDDGGMDVVLDGVVLRGQAEGVEADGEQHVIAVHAALAGHHVHGGVGPGVAHVQALAGGIGELHQAVEFGLGGVAGLGGEGLFLAPLVLPFLLDGGKIVFHVGLLYLKFFRIFGKIKRPGALRLRGAGKRGTTLIWPPVARKGPQCPVGTDG